MYQVIFQVKSYNSEDHNWSTGKWLDYCREPSPHPYALNLTNIWAKTQCDWLEEREGKPFRFFLEHWGEAQEKPNG